MSRKLTEIIFYQNTPFTDFENYIDFGSNEARDAFFDSHYNPHKIKTDFNFVRDRLTLRVGLSVATWSWLSECNYLSFENDFDGIRYYCQVTEARYLNNNCIELNLVIDALTTFCQGDISKYAKNVLIHRQHLTTETIGENIDSIRRDGDIINFSSEKYIKQEAYSMIKFIVIFRTSVDLTKDFGTLDSPKIKSSKGVIFDQIVSPQNLYMTHYDKFNSLMKELENYPWVTQNITSVLLVPETMIESKYFEKVKLASGDFDDLYEFQSGGMSSNLGKLSSISKSQSDLLKIFDIENHPELLKKGYCDIDITNYQGQHLQVDMGLLPNDGMNIRCDIVLGYSNQMYFYIDNYQGRNVDPIGNLRGGSYIDDSIAFTKFDSIPILTDNYRLNYAQSAHQRNLAQNNLISGQIGNVFDNSASIQDRFMSAVNLTSDVSVGALTGKLTDEWQYYRKLNAELADKKLTPPSVSEMSNENSFPLKQNYFGIVIRYKRISDADLKKAKNYVSHFGYAWECTGNLEPTNSMKYLNYVKFSGNWVINDRHIPQSIMEQLRAQFENGVKIWHNPDNLANPFKQDISDLNEREI